MPFFQPAFYAPAQVDSNAFANIFQLINDIDGYQQGGCESACKPKQQQQQAPQQRQAPAQPKAQPKPQPAQKPAQTQKKPEQTFRHPFEEFLNSLQQAAAAAAPAAAATASASPAPAHAPEAPTYHPRFDVRETNDAYELYGELAGVDRSNIALEFTEPQTLVVSGKSERNYTQRVPAVENTPDAISDTHSEPDDASVHSRSGARTPDEDFTEIASQRSVSPARSHRATVTDEEDEEALEKGSIVDAPVQSAPVAVQTAPAPVQTSVPASTDKFWFQERAIGNFKREFNFPVPVDEANVRASLENGILSVTVPKAKREVRRIRVL